MKTANPVRWRHAKRISAVSIAITVTILGGMNPAKADENVIVNFEDASSRGLSDNQAVTDQYIREGFTFGLDNDLDGVIDAGSSAALEQTGADTTSGFISKTNGKDAAADGYYDEANGITYADRLGTNFLRTGGLGGNGGNLLISYTNGTSAASGELWDIDGGGNRQEQWLVQALNKDGDIVETITSPLGIDTKGDYESRPWMWSFERESADIKAIRMVFSGEGKASSVGLAFDNFSAYSVERPVGATVTPVPYELESSLGLMGVAGIIGYRKFKSKLKRSQTPVTFN
ncbi:hypothetical protein IQ266_08700 [filamentous cyanobacterium LEGE 11480]|uniref:PEP-CTERM sorting domain-containing protein n=1 Tax=Romeriopsis navalis LEGE 11480 TaxID=2777977 RepID=A0A928VK42_9CYAN|nr:hypothetical protein [Romeriopsis navalis]MBE9029805.1 hypothetical protein [Romeriopsis navalis LEGE 11480]